MYLATLCGYSMFLNDYDNVKLCIILTRNSIANLADICRIYQAHFAPKC